MELDNPESRLFASKKSLLKHERNGMLNNGKHIISTFINEKIRAITIDWLMQVWKMFKMKHPTFHSAVAIMDAFLGRNNDFVDRNEVQLVGLVALSLASLYNDVRSHETTDYVFVSDNQHTAKQIHDMQNKMFIALGCNANVPCITDYFRIVAAVSAINQKAYTACTKILFAFSLEGTEFLPSVCASAAVKLYTLIHKDTKFVNYFDVPDHVLNSCVFHIADFLRRVSKSILNAHTKMGKLSENMEWAATIERVIGLKLSKPPASETELDYSISYHFVPNISIKLLDPDTVSKNLKQIGQGSFGDVKLGKYEGTNYAIKVSRPNWMYDRGTLDSSFMRETSILQSLTHKNIIPLSYITSDLRSIFLPLGESDLKAWLNRHGAFDKDQQDEFAKRMFAALAYMHDIGCLHRDIKPQNIIVFLDNGKPIYKLTDFGASRGCQIALRDNAFTHEVCTLPYRSPELLLGSETYNSGLDVWSMLCTLYECATNIILFLDDSEIATLFKIYRILGTPNEDTWPDVIDMPGYSSKHPQFKRQIDFFIGNSLLSDVCINLLVIGLDMDPSARPTAHEIVEVMGYIESEVV